MHEQIPKLIEYHSTFLKSKDKILAQWVEYQTPKEILQKHEIDETYFINKYASGVFNYFMGVIAGTRELGNCPVMEDLLIYFKHREISSDELFEICSHFRRSMIDFSYDAELNSKDLFDEISYVFDKNFKGILKFYTDTIINKLEEARKNALQAGQAKEYFLSNMSHEIRTPLNAILGFVHLLTDEKLTKKQRSYLDIILSSGENLLSIINDILDFSKLRSGEFTIESRTFSLHEELSHTMELFVASANSKDITITSFIDPMIPKELDADALRIKQILSNFLSNAIKFTHKGGVISVVASCHDNVLRISVRDNGIGIDKEDINTIFTAFAQAQYTECNNADGTGLGLSICHQLAALMKGSVFVNSKRGEGSTFWLEIPVEIKSYQCLMFDDIQDFQKLKMIVYSPNMHKSFQYESFIKYANIFHMDIEILDTLKGDFDVAIYIHEDIDILTKEYIKNSKKQFIALMSKQYDEYEQFPHIKSMCFPLYCSKIHTTFSELIKPETFVPYTKKNSPKFVGHVLVAEDNEANRELIKIILIKYGLSFDIVNNGLEALNLYKKNGNYDLILMDEQMPVMNGIEAIKEILKHEIEEGLSHTPISALTANVIKGARERGLLSGFDSFLGKPIVLKELERVFSIYLKSDAKESVKTPSSEKIDIIKGLDTQKLSDELLLNYDEIVMLVNLFIKKMAKVLPELKEAIDKKEYKKIALFAHSVKGASGNFRIESLQNDASVIESMAKSQNGEFNYYKAFESLRARAQEIEVI